MLFDGQVSAIQSTRIIMFYMLRKEAAGFFEPIRRDHKESTFKVAIIAYFKGTQSEIVSLKESQPERIS